MMRWKGPQGIQEGAQHCPLGFMAEAAVSERGGSVEVDGFQEELDFDKKN